MRAVAEATKGDTLKTLQDAYTAALVDCWADAKAKNTLARNARTWLTEFGPETPLVSITTSMVDTTLADLVADDLAPATVNRKLAALSVMLKNAADKGWLKDLPRLKRKKETGHRPYWYTEDEEQAMLEACRALSVPELADFITFAIDTGFRRSEILKAKPEDLRDGYLWTYGTKNGENRTVYATENVVRIVTAAAQAKKRRVFDGLTEAILRARWSHMRELLDKTEDPKYIVHVLRHTTATRLAQGGATAQEIMQYMGHKSITTSMIYVHMMPKQMVKTAALLERQGVAQGGLRLVAG